MKTIKLTSKLLKDAEYLMRGVEAVRGNRAYPSYVYMNPSDYKALERNVRAQYKKEYSYLSTEKLRSAVGFHMLNYGPVEVKGVAKGHVIVDNRAIDEAALAEDEQVAQNGR